MTSLVAWLKVKHLQLVSALRFYIQMIHVYFLFLFAKPNISVDPSDEDRLLSCICSLLIWDEIPEAKVYGVVFYYLVGDHGSFILQLLVIRVFTH